MSRAGLLVLDFIEKMGKFPSENKFVAGIGGKQEDVAAISFDPMASGAVGTQVVTDLPDRGAASALVQEEFHRAGSLQEYVPTALRTALLPQGIELFQIGDDVCDLLVLL